MTRETENSGQDSQAAQLGKEDSRYTEDMKKYTCLVENLIENEENRLTKLYDSFKSLFIWAKSQLTTSGNTDLKLAAIKQEILDKCMQLRNEAARNMLLIDSMQKSTENQKRTERKKMNLKISVIQNYEQQKDLSRVVDYPKDIVALTKQVIKLVEKSEDLTHEDINIEEKTRRFLEKFLGLTKAVHDKVSSIISLIINGKDLTSIESDIEVLLGEIDQTIKEFKNLSKLERIHLQLLLEINKDEAESIEKEGYLDKATAGYDREKGYEEDQDGSVILKRS